MRTVEAGDTVDGHEIRIEPAIEIGNIFKLGTRYSVPLGATYLDEDGDVAADLDGLLRHRPGAHRRRRGRAVRRREGHLLAALAGAVRRAPGRARQAGHRRSSRSPRSSTTSCARLGLDVIYDDRDLGPGAKFADAELLGVPLRLTVGRRTLEAGEIEAQVRRGRETRSVPLEGAAQAAADLWATLP